ncbi:kinesin-like protein KIF20B isoform X3 [Festucalex cinctus]
MMETCCGKPERVGPVEVGDIKRNLLDEFSALSKQDEIRSENLQVYLRIRPFSGAESRELQDCVSIEGRQSVVLKAPRSSQSNRQGDKIPPHTAQRFTFTQVFGPEASQRQVFEGSVRGLVQDVLQGQNCLLFTYGVTNAGKSFTFLGPEHDSGLLPRCLWLIFSSTEGRRHDGSHLKPHRWRDFSRLTPDQQKAERAAKHSLLRTVRENDKNATSARSTSLDASSVISDCSVSSVSESDGIGLPDVPANVAFSVWVSFCEIYNDNIHDLLEQVPGGHVKRTTLRLSQDIRGNSFIKDLKWVQVSSSEEAFKLMNIGKKNQSLACTRLNQQSSRSHSIFSIRILQVDAGTVPRFLGVSELVLCDLAGSERCSRTNNTGERLKEAGNINSSLLALGKCINAMRVKQNSNLQRHVPFRESKLTHFLQSFFCGAGKVSMVVNIQQNSTCVDETLNVLKFSALAQKVVVLNSKPAVLDSASHRLAMELSAFIDEADQRRNARIHRSSTVAWETTLEDVMEDDDEENDEEDDESGVEGTVLKAGDDDDDDADGETTIEDEDQSDKEAEFRLVAEARIREEVCAEFMEVFKQMEKDYSERLERERDILEKRAESRLEILKKLLGGTAQAAAKEEEQDEGGRSSALLEEVLSLVGRDLHQIRHDARNVQRQLMLDLQVSSPEAELRQEVERSEPRLQHLQGQSDATAEAQEEEEGECLSGAFHANMAQLRKEWQAAVESSAHQSKALQEVMQEKMCSDRKCEQLTEELANQKAEYCQQLGELRAELERQGAALRQKMEEDVERQQELQRVLREKGNLSEEHRKQMDAMRRELECAKMQQWREEKEEKDEERKANEEKPALPLVEELKEEMLRLHHRKEQRKQETLSQDSSCCLSNGGRSASRKRKSCQVEDLCTSDNKRNKRAIRNGTQQAPSSAIEPSPAADKSAFPSVLSSAAQSVFGRPVAVATKPKQGRKKLYRKEAAVAFVDSPRVTVAERKQKESDHMIIKRQLRSKTGRK